jgi:drug/metabolite transporter (DMT)-like permease
VSGRFTPNQSPLRLIITGAVCLIGGVVLANLTSIFPQFANPLIDSAALIAGALIGLAGALTLAIATILAVAARR